MNVLKSPQIQMLVKHYQTLAPREQLAVKVLVIFFAALATYGMLWVPVNDFLSESKQNYVKQTELLSYLRDSEAQARAQTGSIKKAKIGQSILQVISRSAQTFSLKPNKLQPEGNDGVSIRFDEVSFNTLALWLESLSKQGYTVRQLSVDRGDTLGMVSARIVVRN